MKNIIDMRYKFGKPWQIEDENLGVVVPIILRDNVETYDRDYRLIEEVDDENISISDSGEVKEVNVENKSGNPIFIRGGNMFEGKGTQSRATQFGIIILPEKKEKAKVKCVHSTHGVSKGSSFAFTEHHSSRNMEKALLSGKQDKVWSTVSNVANKLRAKADGGEAKRFSNTNNMVEVKKIKNEVDEFKEDVSEIINKMPDIDRQVGVVVLNDSGVVGLEVFDHPDSWDALRESVIEKYEETIRKEGSGIFEPNMAEVEKAVKDFVEKGAKADMEVAYNNDKSLTKVIKGDEIIGEMTTFNENLIHLVLSKNEKEDKSKKKSQNENPWDRDYPDIDQFNDEFINPFDTTRYKGWKKLDKGSYKALGGKNEKPKLTKTVAGKTGSLYFQPNFLSKKGATEILSECSEYPKVWSELDIDVSTKTKSERLKEAVNKGLLEKKERADGKEGYILTEKGKENLKKIDDINALFES